MVLKLTLVVLALVALTACSTKEQAQQTPTVPTPYTASGLLIEDYSCAKDETTAHVVLTLPQEQTTKDGQAYNAFGLMLCVDSADSLVAYEGLNITLNYALTLSMKMEFSNLKELEEFVLKEAKGIFVMRSDAKIINDKSSLPMKARTIKF